MKKIITSGLFVAVFLVSGVEMTAYAQIKQNSQSRYKDAMGENPTADADIKLVSDYVNTLVGGDADKAKLLLAGNYKGYGPSAADSSATEKTMNTWKQNYKTQSNRKVSFVAATFHVKSGSLKGNWVSLWGNYGFTQNGKNIMLPIQYTARVANGKIDTDRIYYDNLSVVQALGYKLTPPAASADASK